MVDLLTMLLLYGNGKKSCELKRKRIFLVVYLYSNKGFNCSGEILYGSQTVREYGGVEYVCSLCMVSFIGNEACSNTEYLYLKISREQALICLKIKVSIIFYVEINVFVSRFLKESI